MKRLMFSLMNTAPLGLPLAVAILGSCFLHPAPPPKPVRPARPGRLFYVWLIPLAWAGSSLLSFLHPGDEYGLWAVSSIVGTWWAFFVPIGDIHQWWIPWAVALSGMAALAPLGWVMDWLKVSRRLWGALWLAGSVGMLLTALLNYESIARALAKNGSWQAYIFASLNMGLYLSMLGSLGIWGIYRGVRRVRVKGKANP